MRSWLFGIESIGDKLRKIWLRWFRHVQCRATTVQLMFYQKRVVQLIKKKFSSCRLIVPKEKGYAGKDMDVSSKVDKEIQPIRRFGPKLTKLAKQNSCNWP